MVSLTVLTPEKTIFEGEIALVNIPGTVGYFEILPNHAPMISTLQPGQLTITLPEGSKKIYAISAGTFENCSNRSVILGEAVEEASEIDIERAKEAYNRAYKRLEFPDSSIDQHRATLALLRAKNRIDVYNRASNPH